MPKNQIPNTKLNYDFTEAVNDDFIKRGRSNELPTSMLSVIDSSISKEVPNDSKIEEQNLLPIPQERKFSFMAGMSPCEQKEIIPKSEGNIFLKIK